MTEAVKPERFRHNPTEFVGVAAPTLIYVGIKDRAEFDRIAVPCTDHGEDFNGHVLSKAVVQRTGADEVRVVFQYWLKSLTPEAMLSEMDRRRAAKATGEQA